MPKGATFLKIRIAPLGIFFVLNRFFCKYENNRLQTDKVFDRYHKELDALTQL